MKDKYVVVGNPIEHSKSPEIHQMFALQTGELLQYERLLAPLDDFELSMRQYLAEPAAQGANVTVPFKQQAFELCDEVSEAAQVAQAVNTLVKLSNGRIRGDNTDGFGLVSDLQRHIKLVNKRVLLVGAGGAARGALLPLITAQVAQIDIVNRTYNKADALMTINPDKLQACHYETLASGYDIIINATSASLQGQLVQLPPHTIASHTLCYDMMYSAQPTQFNQWAQQHGAQVTLDGLGMLVGQAAQSFYLWRGVMPDVAPILASIRQQLVSSR